MGFFSDVDIEIRESIDSGASRYQIEKMYPFMSDSDIDVYFADECDDGEYYVSSLNDPFDEESVR